MTLPHADRLPARDWPLESLNAGDRVIAWYTPDAGTRSRGELWQLHRGYYLRVVALEDTRALYHAAGANKTTARTSTTIATRIRA